METEQFLYHYTGIGTAEKVVRTRALWATNIYYLNDGSEFRHGIELMRRTLRESARKHRSAGKFLDAVEWSALESPRLRVFVVSFSEAGDLLSQWRSYCPPNRGVSLGFEASELELAGSQQGFGLVRCSYNLRRQNLAIKNVASHWQARFQAASSDAEQSAIVDEFAIDFAQVAASHKDPSFAEEREWRLITVRRDADPTEIQYREGVSTLIPYVEFGLPIDGKGRLRMRRVVVGPTPHWELTCNAVGNMVREGKVLWGQITPSRTPYRAW
ncbi:MAG TPA: DUF2971 domain-containing protein [Thermoanaerobaculia bacterium]|nr:DUF2971 domain-containing protein [Thermoanaerobaculia bacterium]